MNRLSEVSRLLIFSMPVRRFCTIYVCWFFLLLQTLVFFILEHFNIVNECVLVAIKLGTCEAGLQTFTPMPVDVSAPLCVLFRGRVALVL